MTVRPSWVKEYSTAMAFDPVTRLAINPVDSIPKRSGKHPLGDAPEVATQLPVSMRPFFQRKQDLGVHLPIKIGEGVFVS